MNSRIPIYILAVLVVAAIIIRIANPPAPPLPGPLGNPPNWDSGLKVGTMAASAVNPSGTMWAGAWNQKAKDGGLHSALVLIDLEKKTAQRQDLGKGVFTNGLGWADDDTVRVMLTDSEEPTLASNSRIAYLRKASSSSPKFESGERLPAPVERVLSWPVGSDTLLAQMATPDSGLEIAVLSKGAVVGKAVSMVPPKGSEAYRVAALAPDGSSFVFSTATKTGGDLAYWYVDAKTGANPRMLASTDLPGRVEGIWTSPAGVLMVVSQRDKFQVLRYDPKSGKVAPAAGDIKAQWPDAPEYMMFATYNGGYRLDLATGNTKRLFDLTRQGKDSDEWRRRIQDGRLYPRKDGNYTSVSTLANEVDIRIIEKDGDKGGNILPRG